jgi:hypothetical protein
VTSITTRKPLTHAENLPLSLRDGNFNEFIVKSIPYSPSLLNSDTKAVKMPRGVVRASSRFTSKEASLGNHMKITPLLLFPSQVRTTRSPFFYVHRLIAYYAQLFMLFGSAPPEVPTGRETHARRAGPRLDVGRCGVVVYWCSEITLTRPSSSSCIGFAAIASRKLISEPTSNRHLENINNSAY